MLERLFSSRVRIDLIAHFVLHPGGRYHARGLEKALGAHYSAVWRELRNLKEAGLVVSEEDAGRKVYRLNQDFPLLDELRGMFLKTAAAGDRIRKALEGHDGIVAAFIYGSYALGQADAYSDLDLMVIGDVELPSLSQSLSELEAELGRPVNYIMYTLAEWRSKLANRDPFATDVQRGPKLMLVGSEDVLRGSVD